MPGDAQLLSQAADGDKAAWDLLVDRHSQMIYANARVVGASQTLAEDIVQVVWMRLLTKLDTIREPSKLKGWLALVARNATRDELRKKRTEYDIDSLIGVHDSETDTAESAIHNADLDMLDQHFDALDERCKRLFSLLFFAQVSYAEVAELLEIPPGSVRYRKEQCLAETRQLMDQAS